MSHLSEHVEKMTGLPCPRPLLELIDSGLLRDLCPLTIRFANVEWIFPIQEVHDPSDVAKYDEENQRYQFALNDDGFPLHIDLASERLEILQEEFGNVDSLGIGVVDLLNSISHRRYTSHKTE